MKLSDLIVKIELCEAELSSLIKSYSANPTKESFKDSLWNYHFLLKYYLKQVQDLPDATNDAIKLKKRINDNILHISRLPGLDLDIMKPEIHFKDYIKFNSSLLNSKTKIFSYNTDFLDAYLACGKTFTIENCNQILVSLCEDYSNAENLVLVEKIINLGADPNTKETIQNPFDDEDENPETPLSLAIQNQKTRIAQYLIKHQADIEQAKKILKYNDFEFAVATGDLAAVQKAISQSNGEVVKKNDGILFIAAKANNHEIVKLLLKNGADPNYEEKQKTRKANLFLEKHSYFKTPLLVAAQSNNNTIIDDLLEAGANPNYECYGGSALIEAARLGHNKAVKSLLRSSKIDVNIKKDGLTAEEIARKRKHVETAELIHNFPKLLILEGQLRSLLSELLISSSEKNSKSRKNKLLSQLHTQIEKTDFYSFEEYKIAVKNVIMLSLQHRNFGITNTTRTGNLLKKLIQDNKYEDLKKFLFPGNTSIRYRDFRKLFIENENNTKFFSSRNKEKMYTLFSKIDENFVNEKDIETYVSENMKKRT